MSNGMVNWRAKQIRKRGKRSETPGKSKGDSCQTDATKKFYFSHPHAFRDANYAEWHEKAKRMSHGKEQK